MRTDDNVMSLRTDAKVLLNEIDVAIHRSQRVCERNRWYVMGEDELVSLSLRFAKLVAQLKVLDKGTEQTTRSVADNGE